ncbi:MAG: rod shape-determining protein MreC [Synergistales bacterium]|nr:rod shape-determining protein MreC [Synergistales bacterium]
MMRWEGIQSPWAHSLIACIAGLVLLGCSLQFAGTRDAVNTVTVVLAVPEYPAKALREGAVAIYRWNAERTDYMRHIEKLEQENLALRRALTEQRPNVEPLARPHLVTAMVDLRYPHQWWQRLRVDAGTRQGVGIGDPVLNKGKLVGRVVDVGRSFAWVELLTSSGLSIPVVVEETRDLGVVQGDNRGGVVLRFIPPDRELEEGMHLSTALVGEVFPPGIPVGAVREPGVETAGLRPYGVAAESTFSRLYAVQVLVKRGDRP